MDLIFSRRAALKTLLLGSVAVTFCGRATANATLVQHKISGESGPGDVINTLNDQEIQSLSEVSNSILSSANCAWDAAKPIGDGEYYKKLEDLSGDWSFYDRAFLQASGASLLPLLDALESVSRSPDSLKGDFGKHAEFSHSIRKGKRAVETVWQGLDIPWKIRPVKSNVLSDPVRMADLYVRGLGFDPDRANTVAEQVHAYFNQPKFDYGNSPYFTANAFAFPALSIRNSSGLISEYVTLIGDGMLQVFDEVGLGDVAPSALLAHEHYHHVQQHLKMDSINPSKQSTSPTDFAVTENAADAGGAYVVTHVRGMSFQTKRVEQVFTLFSSIGQTSKQNRTHGTPAERYASAMWGHDKQRNTRPRAVLVPAESFDRDFLGWTNNHEGGV